jgi:alpha-glucosidase (family GH31 glycosyl hydrolase)
MKNGITGIFNFQIFGIPMTGDDICGFGGDSNDNLCARWMSLGLFFPFSRNHNSIDQKPQDPFAFGLYSKTLKSSTIAIKYKYSLLRYYYSQLFKISLGESGSFFKPLFFNFPNDIYTYNIIDYNAMIGDALYLIPNFNINDTIKDYEGYFPNANWNTFPYGINIVDYDKKSEGGKKINLSGNYSVIHLFMRGGFIIPYQETFSITIKNSRDLRNYPTEIIINPDENYCAQGEVIFDDDDVYTLQNKNYLKVKMNFNYTTINFIIENNFNQEYPFNDDKISNIKFFRMSYLNKNKNYMIRIDTYNRKIYHVLLKNKGNDIYETNISKYYLRFQDISSIKLLDLNKTKNLKILI